jgi:hypothetical protein
MKLKSIIRALAVAMLVVAAGSAAPQIAAADMQTVVKEK